MRHRMRALGFLAPLALVLVLAAAACEAPQASSSSNPASGTSGATGARISVDTDTVDFGQVALDKEVRATFNVKNVGTETLTLREVKLRLVEGC